MLALNAKSMYKFRLRFDVVVLSLIKIKKSHFRTLRELSHSRDGEKSF